ncbi:ATP-dependent DNA helicase [Trichonephila clavipes]|nr:ATP-dependent DNA helicase [Trichonephila clavipes]
METGKGSTMVWGEISWCDMGALLRLETILRGDRCKKERSDWQQWHNVTRRERAEDTEEQISRRLAAMAQPDQERRAEEMEEQISHRLSTMAQLAKRRRVNVTEEQNCLQNGALCKFRVQSGTKTSIDEVSRRVNPFAATYIMMWKLEQQVLHEEGYEASENVTMYISDERLYSDQHRGRSNALKINEVAMVIKSCDSVPPNNRDICIYPKQRQLCRISTLNPNCDPINYVLFFPCGEKGFRVNQCFTELQFYVHRLSVRRDIFNHILHGGKLMH